MKNLMKPSCHVRKNRRRWLATAKMYAWRKLSAVKQKGEVRW